MSSGIVKDQWKVKWGCHNASCPAEDLVGRTDPSAQMATTTTLDLETRAVPPVETPVHQMGEIFTLMDAKRTSLGYGLDPSVVEGPEQPLSNDESSQQTSQGNMGENPTADERDQDISEDDDHRDTKSDGEKREQDPTKPGLPQRLAQKMDEEAGPPKMTPEQALAKLLGRGPKAADISTEGARPTAGAESSRKGPSDTETFSKTVGVLSKLKRWGAKTKAASDSLEKYPGHIQDVRDRGRQEKTELPLPLMIMVKEEALPIVQNLAKAYKVAMGKHHKLTTEAFVRYEELKKELSSAEVFL